jgi:hypothetical protein
LIEFHRGETKVVALKLNNAASCGEYDPFFIIKD